MTAGFPTTMNTVTTTTNKAHQSKHAQRMAKGMSGPYQLEKHDVCCGRGKGYWNHPGNQAFQKIVQANAYKYGESSSKVEKSRLVDGIVRSILNTGARFLRQDTASGFWFDIGESMARDKTGHAIRDHLLNQKKSKAKSAIKKRTPTNKNKGSTANSRASTQHQAQPQQQQQYHEQHFQQPAQQSQEDCLQRSLDKPVDRSSFNTLRVPIFSLPSNSNSDASVNFEKQGRYIRDMIDSIVTDQTCLNLSKEVTTSDLSEQEVLEVCELLSEEDDDELRPIPLLEEFNLDTDIFPADWMGLKLF